MFKTSECIIREVSEIKKYNPYGGKQVELKKIIPSFLIL
jgi:hypothetical protein